MKRFKFIKNIAWVGVFLLAACSDFLKEKSQDEVIVTTVSDFSQLLLGSGYVDIAYDALYYFDDDLELDPSSYWGDEENSFATQYYGHYTWQPDMWGGESYAVDAYTMSYKKLAGVNATLDGIDDAIGDPEERDQVKAEAYALRGYYYFMLVNIFCEPYNYNKNAEGVPLKLAADLLENGIARSTVEDVYRQIIKDLKASIELFEKYPKRRGSYRINISTAQVLLSRVFLYMEKWQEAVDAATEAIKTGEGLTDYTKIQMYSEFEMASYKHSEVEWLYNAWIEIPYGYIPSEDLMSTFTGDDRRLDLWFPWGTCSKKTIMEWGAPVNTIRISEAYLNRAEAYVQLKKQTEALEDLNMLCRHRIEGFEDLAIADGVVLLEEIRQERRRELCFDELRWFDLRRYGMPSISHKYKVTENEPWVIYTLEEKDPLYTIPIPESAIGNNVLLKQNPSAYAPARKGVIE